jgi:hypothetical protein
MLLAAALALVPLACTGDDAEPEPTSSPSPAEAQDTGEPADDGAAAEAEVAEGLEGAPTVGEPVTEGRFEFAVTDFSCDEEVAVDAEPSGRFCVLTLEATNGTDIDQAVDTGAHLLIDEAGTEYAPASEATQELGGEEMTELVPPGESATVRLVYDVPEGALIVGAVLHDELEGEGQQIDLRE